MRRLRNLFALLLSTVLPLSCGTPLWTPPQPTLSVEQLPQGWSVETDVYSLILAPEGGDSRDHPLRAPIIVAESTVTDDVPTSSSGFLEGHWPAAVKAGFDSAFADLARYNANTLPISAAAVHELRLNVGSPKAFCGARNGVECKEPVSSIRLSAIGFNSDSTYAVIYRAMHCGPLCGTGVIFLLRRSPGARFTIWSGKLLWIS